MVAAYGALMGVFIALLAAHQLWSTRRAALSIGDEDRRAAEWAVAALAE